MEENGDTMNDRTLSANNLFRFSSSILNLDDEDGFHSRNDTFDGSRSDSVPVCKSYDYTLKFLLVGDSDVGKEEILNGLVEETDEETNDSSFCGSPGVNFKSTVILLDGKRIRLQLWDTSGQGRFSTIIRSYSRGAQGILIVYDITNKWSFASLNRWLMEVAEHAPGVPKILLGNRLHLAFKRQVHMRVARSYAYKHNMSFFEVSPLCNYNIRESFVELSRVVLQRHGMDSLFRNHNVLSLQELCCRAIVTQTTVYGIEQLPLPPSIKSNLKSFSKMSSCSLVKPGFSHHHIFTGDQTHRRNISMTLPCKRKPSKAPRRAVADLFAEADGEPRPRGQVNKKNSSCTIS
ncbi:Ras-related protein Rab-40C [Halotydeus destructor]|nr:Ras-related protein Rab-40C [Halotydeus destructor]